MILPGLVTVPTSGPIQLDSGTETDVEWGSSIWFTVGAADIYIGPDNSVMTSGQGYAQGGHRGRKCVQDPTCNSTSPAAEHVFALASGSQSICEVLQTGM